MSILITALKDSIITVLLIARVVIPLMILMQLIKDLKVLDRVSRYLRPVMGIFRLPSEAAFPLLVGTVFGLTYGAGVILKYLKEGTFTQQESFLILCFLSMCHAVFEDTILFNALGGQGITILLARFASAVVLTFVLSRRMSAVKTSQPDLKQ